MKNQNSYQASDHGKLYLVPTPIGNLEDMTLRAIRILGEVDVILAEDTRNSIKLLNHFEIQGNLESYHAHSSPRETEAILERLEGGVDMALISDAGMPLVNDPGNHLVSGAIERGIPVIPLPGANAAMTALVASGLPADQFTYYGFFPRVNKEQVEVLERVGQRTETAIFYESPYRLKAAVKAVEQVLGADNPVVIAREISKKFEEFIRGTASEVSSELEERGVVKGECVLLIGGGALPQVEADELVGLPFRDQVLHLMEVEELSSKDAIKEIAKRRGVKKQDVYAAYHELNEEI